MLLNLLIPFVLTVGSGSKGLINRKNILFSPPACLSEIAILCIVIYLHVSFGTSIISGVLSVGFVEDLDENISVL